jgi:hypothetical protein
MFFYVKKFAGYCSNCGWKVDVEWHIGSAHGSGARGPGFDSHPDPDIFIGSSNLPYSIQQA